MIYTNYHSVRSFICLIFFLGSFVYGQNAPIITSASSKNFAENSTSTVITVESNDEDADATATYSISGGADAADFNIDGKPIKDVVLRNDWENVHSILEELRQEKNRIYALQDV